MKKNYLFHQLYLLINFHSTPKNRGENIKPTLHHVWSRDTWEFSHNVLFSVKCRFIDLTLFYVQFKSISLMWFKQALQQLGLFLALTVYEQGEIFGAVTVWSYMYPNFRLPVSPVDQEGRGMEELF